MNLKTALVAFAVATMGVAGAADHAKASTWVLSGVSFNDGGTLSGTFTLTPYGYFGTFDLISTGGSIITTGVLYETPPGINGWTVGAPQPTVLDFSPLLGGYTGELQLTFKYGLGSISGPDPIVGGLSGPSWECVGSYSCYLGNSPHLGRGLIRYVASGDTADSSGAAIETTPLPSTWTMLMASFLGLGLLLHRGMKKNSAALAAA
jgi:hypothetical protein